LRTDLDNLSAERDPVVAFTNATLTPLDGVTAPATITLNGTATTGNSTLGHPDTCLWDFDDGATSWEASPAGWCNLTHTYNSAGTYSPALIVNNSYGGNNTRMGGIIRILAAGGGGAPPIAMFNLTVGTGADLRYLGIGGNNATHRNASLTLSDKSTGDAATVIDCWSTNLTGIRPLFMQNVSLAAAGSAVVFPKGAGSWGKICCRVVNGAGNDQWCGGKFSVLNPWGPG
jgi:hypothetical protein